MIHTAIIQTEASVHDWLLDHPIQVTHRIEGGYVISLLGLKTKKAFFTTISEEELRECTSADCLRNVAHFKVETLIEYAKGEGEPIPS